jgi:TPR repeat protein
MDYFLLGYCFGLRSYVCKKDLDKAKENFLLASELGYVLAMEWLGDICLMQSDLAAMAMVGPGGSSWNQLVVFV